MILHPVLMALIAFLFFLTAVGVGVTCYIVNWYGKRQEAPAQTNRR